MGSPTSKAITATLEVGSAASGILGAAASTPSRAADYVYRIAALTAGIALFATFI